MNKMIRFPVVVREVETQDEYVFHDIDELKLFVEEFWDILEEEFDVRDHDGRSLSFDQSFLDSATRAKTHPGKA